MKNLRILAPRSMSIDGWNLLRERTDVEAIEFDDDADPSALHFDLQHADGIVLGHIHFSATEIGLAPRLRAVGRLGVGVDNVDVKALADRRIPLVVTGDANSTSVAEHTLAFMLMLSKQMIEMAALVREDRWQDRKSLQPADLETKTVLIIGLGRIGTRLAERCIAMDMSVLGYDPTIVEADAQKIGCEMVPDLERGLSRADFVCVLCPKTKDTLNLLDAGRLRRMKPTAFLINTARGGIVDEVALYDALLAGKIKGAAFDVFADEPVRSNNPLLSLNNFLPTPHLAGTSTEAASRMAKLAVGGVLDALSSLDSGSSEPCDSRVTD